MWPDTATCETWGSTTSNQWTSSVGGSPARTSAWQDSGQDSKGSEAHSGQSSPESFASLGQDGCWLKTCQGFYQATLTGSLEPFSGTWPRQGMLRSGRVYRRRPLVRRTYGGGCSLLPTPTDASKGGGSSRSGSRRGEIPTLQGMARKGIWPTPTVNGNYNRKGCSATSGDGLATVVGGQLNPQFVEWLMNFPKGWTDLTE